jgi:S1-C subfamily serine protease
VEPGTPAERCGLRIDDIITAIDGVPVQGADGLMLELGRLPAEAAARLQVLRGQEQIPLDVVLAKYPVVGKRIVTRPAPDWRGMRVDFTTAVANPDAVAVATNFFGEGVIVTDVEEGKPAWKAGIRPGMRIRQVDETPVNSPRQFRAAVAEKPGPVQIRLAAGNDGQPESVRTVGAGG